MARPNVVFVVADDMGYGDFGAFNPSTRTPTLDRLMGEGVALTQHYSESPVCTPARAGLLTGRYHHRTGAIDMRESRGLDRISLRETTIADVFKRAGYRTGMVGKWHNGEFDQRYHPRARGFDEFVGFCGGWHWYFDWVLDFNGAFKRSDGRYLTDVFTDEAVQFIRSHAGRPYPFFLMLTYNTPHTPLEVPEDEIVPYRETGRFNEAVSRIYAMIAHMDKGIERVLAELSTQGIQDNTIFLFTSDNGPQFGGKGEHRQDRFNCGFRGSKSHVYEGGIRVPMIVRWPEGGLTRGRRIDDFVHFTDWLPSLVAAAGQEAPGELDLDGCNILPVLRGEKGQSNPRRFWQWNRYTPVAHCNAAMRDGDWKLVRPQIPSLMQRDPKDGAMDEGRKRDPEKYVNVPRYDGPLPERDIPAPQPAQLFNLAQDPNEEHDLAQAHPDRARGMLRELETWFESVEAERATIRE